MFWFLGLLLLIVITYSFLDWLFRSLTINNMSEKYVLITGCDSGFGKALAVHLDSLGFHVFAGCFTADGPQSLSKCCSNKLITLPLDITKEESIEAAFQHVKNNLPSQGGLWALVNNAGIGGILTKTEFCTKEHFQSTLDTNLLGLIEMTKKFLPLVRISQGRIINVSSILGRIALNAIPYCVSKYGVEAFSDVLRREVYRQGIKVSLIEPSFFKTNLLNKEKSADSARQAYNEASSEVKNAYDVDQLVEKLTNVLSQIEINGSSNIMLVVDAITHAIMARFPRTRYPVGTDAKFFFIPLSYLPDWIIDPVIMRICKKSEQTDRGA